MSSEMTLVNLTNGLVTGLVHERRLEELLNGDSRIIRDDTGKFATKLPNGINLNLSMYAQTLAKVARGWFNVIWCIEASQEALLDDKSWRHFGDKLKRTGCHQKAH